MLSLTFRCSSEVLEAQMTKEIWSILLLLLSKRINKFLGGQFFFLLLIFRRYLSHRTINNKHWFNRQFLHQYCLKQMLFLKATLGEKSKGYHCAYSSKTFLWWANPIRSVYVDFMWSDLIQSSSEFDSLSFNTVFKSPFC